jgi:hypothetical protein
MLLKKYRKNQSYITSNLDSNNILDYECVRRLVIDMNPGDAVNEDRCDFLQWVPRFQAKYPRLMALKRLDIKAMKKGRGIRR